MALQDGVHELFRQDELSLLRELLPDDEVQSPRVAHSSAPQGFPQGLDLAPSAPTFAQEYLPVRLASGGVNSLAWEAPTSTASSLPAGSAQQSPSALEAHRPENAPLSRGEITGL